MPPCLRTLLALLAASGAAYASPAGQKYALIVGVNAHDQQALPHFRFAENDAEGLAVALGPEGAGFAKVVVLTTGRGAKNPSLLPTAKNIREQLRGLSARASRSDLLLVALSGHGRQVVLAGEGATKGRDEPFFCPSDARPKPGQTLEEAQASMIPIRELFKSLDDASAGARLLLVDACRFDFSADRCGIFDPDVLPRPGKGTAVLFSCKPGERSWEAEKLGGGRGVFFHHVIRGLDGGARNRKGEVTWDDLSCHVVSRLREDVRAVIGGGAEQTPCEVRNLDGPSPVLRHYAEVQPAAQRLFAEAEACWGGAGAEVDQPRAVRLYREAAQKGHPVAAGFVGLRTYEGEGVEKDAAEGKRLAAEALPAVRAEAAKGDPAAMWCLAELYKKGIAVDKDGKQAFHWCARAAGKGHKGAMESLGHMHRNGVVGTRDEAEAVRWYRRAAEEGHASSMGWMGAMCRDGRGVARDDAEAARWFRKGADKGDSSAMCCLGAMCRDGRGVERDDAEAARWFRKGAERKNAVSMVCLGAMYGKGRGVTQDDVEAARWFRRAADMGCPAALTTLGVWYEQGRGVARDDAEALRWFRKAADKAHPFGMHKLGWAYEKGRGVARDDAEAARWYTRAAGVGQPDAMHQLGNMCYEGRGVAQDRAEAVRWWRKAAAKGVKNARITLQAIGED